MLCVAYLINRLPLTVLGNISSSEKLFGHAPDNSHLRAYGSLCYISTLKQGRTKFDPRLNHAFFREFLCSKGL